MDASEISVAELRSALTGPLDAVEERFGPELRFPEDFYRNVPMGEATMVDRDPKLDVGSLVDDTATVREHLEPDLSESPRFGTRLIPSSGCCEQLLGSKTGGNRASR